VTDDLTRGELEALLDKLAGLDMRLKTMGLEVEDFSFNEAMLEVEQSLDNVIGIVRKIITEKEMNNER
jgi:hypothetical protein